jgi:hypothetical protein
VDVWESTIKRTLDALLGSGCVLAWIGREGHFCDPPYLLKPECMSEGLFAAASQDGFFECPLKLDEELSWISDETMVALRTKCPELVDAVDS